MSSSKITFSKLREITEQLQKSNDKPLIDFCNSFDGDNVYDKFKNLLISWNNDVAYELNVNLNDKPTKLSFSYIISQIRELSNSDLTISDDDIIINLGIPKNFTNNSDILPIYEMIYYINISGISINLLDLDINNKKTILDNLPAKVYNLLLNNIIKDKGKILEFDNPLLSSVKLNFLTLEPYMFIKGLFSNYNEDYFRDVIFHLSKRIDGQLLLDSTPLDIEYYIEKYSKEMENQNNA